MANNNAGTFLFSSSNNNSTRCNYITSVSGIGISLTNSNYNLIKYNIVINNTEGIIVYALGTSNIIRNYTLITISTTSKVTGYLFLTAFFTSGFVTIYLKQITPI
ncbi:MAG: hypothetical protein ACXAC8_01040 [Candidatus Hodarchaeales archaeon]